MQCPGYGGLWTQCPKIHAGLLPFERTLFDDGAITMGVAALVFLVVLITFVVWRMTDGLARGSSTRRVARRETIAGDRRAVAAARYRDELIRRAHRYLETGSITTGRRGVLRLSPIAQRLEMTPGRPIDSTTATAGAAAMAPPPHREVVQLGASTPIGSITLSGHRAVAT